MTLYVPRQGAGSERLPTDGSGLPAGSRSPSRLVLDGTDSGTDTELAQSAGPQLVRLTGAASSNNSVRMGPLFRLDVNRLPGEPWADQRLGSALGRNIERQHLSGDVAGCRHAACLLDYPAVCLRSLRE
jgi:hypothetical protein